MNAYIEFLIITELKYVRIPTYVVEIYTPEKTPFLHRIVYKQLKRKKLQMTPSVIRWFDSVETDTYFNFVF